MPSVPYLRRQYGAGFRTPRTPRRLKTRFLPLPTSLEWVRYYAQVGTDREFLLALFLLIRGQALV